MTDRGTQLAQYHFDWPTFDARFLAAAMRWGMVLVLAGCLLWLISLWLKRAERPSRVSD